MRAEHPDGRAVKEGKAPRLDELVVSRESKLRPYGMATALQSQGDAALDLE